MRANWRCSGRTPGTSTNETAPNLYSTLASLKTLDSPIGMNFREVSLSERALSRDPVGAFAKMEKAAKSDYRNAVAELARKSGDSEAEVSRRAVLLSKQSAHGTNTRANERRSHVGFYLIGEGRQQLERELGMKDSWLKRAGKLLKSWPDGLYVVGIELLMVALLAAVVMGAEVSVPTFLVVALFLLPAAESAVAIANQLAVMFVKPRALPKMDYSQGFPGQ
jgi:hypothetical protein